MRTLVISDIHIGDSRYNSALIIELLNREKFDRLVINGDLVDLWVAHTKDIIKDPLIEYITDLALSKEVVWVNGSHDYDGDITIPNVKKVDELIIDDGRKKIRVVLGDDVWFFRGSSWYYKLFAKFLYALYEKYGLDLRSFIHNNPIRKLYNKQRIKKILNHTKH